MSRKRGQHAPLMPRYYEDEKFSIAGERAELLYVRILSWCSQSMTDGVVTDHDVALIGRGMRARAARLRSLCDAKLVEPLTDGRSYRVVAWLDYNPSAEEIRAARASDRRRKGARTGDSVPAGIRPERKHFPAGIRTPTTTATTTTGSDRTPSGSVRSEPAQAAPRCAGGAPQPAPGAEVELVEPFVGDPRQFAREVAAKGKGIGRRTRPVTYPVSQISDDYEKPEPIAPGNPLAEIIGEAFGLPRDD